MYTYYTPKSNKMQGFLGIFPFFVDYADFYVNMIMSTAETVRFNIYSKIVHVQRYRGYKMPLTTKYSFCKGTCKNLTIGKLYLPACIFCTNYRFPIFFFIFNPLFFDGSNAISAHAQTITIADKPMPRY